MEPAVVYGYWPCYSEGDDLVVLDPERQSAEIGSLHVPAPAARPVPVPGGLLPAEGQPASSTWSAFHLVTMGARVSEVAG